MKKKVFSVMATCFCMALLAAATVHAQVPGTAVRATIPFDFSVSGKTLPAGRYEIRRIDSGPDGLIISNLNNKHSKAMFETEPVEARRLSSRPKIMFHRYGDSYFLSEVFAGGDQTGRELVPSRQERTLRRQLASNGNKTQPETVALATD